MVLTILLAVAVVAVAVALFFGLQWASRRYLAARDRAAGGEDERDRIDGELGDIAMIMVGLDPVDRGESGWRRTVGAVSEDYLASVGRSGRRRARRRPVRVG